MCYNIVREYILSYLDGRSGHSGHACEQVAKDRFRGARMLRVSMTTSTDPQTPPADVTAFLTEWWGVRRLVQRALGSGWSEGGAASVIGGAVSRAAQRLCAAVAGRSRGWGRNPSTVAVLLFMARPVAASPPVDAGGWAGQWPLGINRRGCTLTMTSWPELVDEAARSSQHPRCSPPRHALLAMVYLQPLSSYREGRRARGRITQPQLRRVRPARRLPRCRPQMV